MKKKYALFILICVLALFSCSNPSNDNLDDNSTTGAIKLNVLYPNGPSDYLSSTVDALIKVYDSSGNTIKNTYIDDFSNDLTIDSVSCNTGCSIDISLANGSFRGIISDFSVSENSTTTVDVICTSITSWDANFNSIISLYNEPPGQQWRLVSLTSGVKYSFINWANDSKLFFYDSDSNLIFSIDGQGKYEYECDESDEYYIGIAHLEPNPSFGVFNAKLLELETYKESYVSTDGEQVWYQIPVTGGKTYQINWDDYNSGTCSYTGDIIVHYICENSNTANFHSSGGTVKVGENDSMLYIYPFSNECDGTFRLEVVQYSGSAIIIVQ